jgi:phosphorylcholine metabolism protein LicD
MDPSEYDTDPKLIKLLYKAHIDVHNLFVKNNVSYYANGGTHIGARRNEGIIKWDNDVDLEISDKDVPFLMSKDFKEQLDKKGYRIKYHRESDEKYDWLKILSYEKANGKKADIDLFPVYFGIDKAGRMRTYFVSKYVQDLWPKQFAYIDELLPLKQVKFGNGVMIVPNKSNKILSRGYGKSWSKVGYITQDPNSHYDLDEAIKVPSGEFYPAKPFVSAKRQIKLKEDDILLTLEGYGYLSR